MLTFLFEQYGYYPNDLKNNVFIIDNWIFKLLETEYNDEYIDKIDEYIMIVKKNFSNKGPFLIKTRFNKKVSIYDGKRYVLISVYNFNVSLNDLNKFHFMFRDLNKKVELRKIFSVWDERISRIESEAINSLRMDSVYYKKNLEIAMFCLGLAQNAMQYLSEIIIDYGETIENVTLTHKRIDTFDSFEFLNPFNFIVDHPIRDYVELYRNDFIQFRELVDLLEYYRLDAKAASLFLARIMYPIDVLDALEENNSKKSSGLKINYIIEKELSKIKKIYIYLKEKHNIRPITWLEG